MTVEAFLQVSVTHDPCPRRHDNNFLPILEMSGSLFLLSLDSCQDSLINPVFHASGDPVHKFMPINGNRQRELYRCAQINQASMKPLHDNDKQSGVKV